MITQSNSREPSCVKVPLAGRSYDIHIGSESLSDKAGATFATSVMKALSDFTHAVVIADQAIESNWLAHVIGGLESTNAKIDTFCVPSGEPSKSIGQIAELWDGMLDCGTDRRSVVFAVGGGVIGDLAGFAAASFTRGIRFVQVPTTLLAMVDSSVGGKTGINLSGAKNMVGAFWQPELVWIDTDVLSTLPDRSFLSGLAEVVKYGVIDDADFFEWLESNASALVDRDSDALRYAIARSCQSKANVVAEDERETSGRRAILNYGHTFAHAIEATAGYGTLLHGEAVSIGMQMAARLGIAMRLCDSSLLERQTKLLEASRLPITFADASPTDMLPVMKRDKKVAHGKLRFILPTKIGSVDLVSDIDEALVIDAIESTK